MKTFGSRLSLQDSCYYSNHLQDFDKMPNFFRTKRNRHSVLLKLILIIVSLILIIVSLSLFHDFASVSPWPQWWQSSRDTVTVLANNQELKEVQQDSRMQGKANEELWNEAEDETASSEKTQQLPRDLQQQLNRAEDGQGESNRCQHMTQKLEGVEKELDRNSNQLEAELQKENAQLNRELNQTKLQLDKTREENNATEQNLQTCKDELKSTKDQLENSKDRLEKNNTQVADEKNKTANFKKLLRDCKVGKREVNDCGVQLEHKDKELDKRTKKLNDCRVRLEQKQQELETCFFTCQCIVFVSIIAGLILYACWPRPPPKTWWQLLTE